MVVSIEIVLRVYAALLAGEMSYQEADSWSWAMIQKFDEDKLQFEPKENESLVFDLIKFLYGIDMPAMGDRTKTGRTNLDVIDFLKQKKVYEMLKDIKW